MTKVIEPFALEHLDYNHDTLACTGPACGHYTQVVWEGSTRVGCALTECSGFDGFEAAVNGGTLAVCQYYPPGNWRGEKPYTYGTTASRCSNGAYVLFYIVNSGFPFQLANSSHDYQII